MNHTKAALKRQRWYLLIALIFTAIWLLTPLGERAFQHQPSADHQPQ